jgi:hypothetical protein
VNGQHRFPVDGPNFPGNHGVEPALPASEHVIMKWNFALNTSLLLVASVVVTARADESARHFLDRTTIVYDPRDEQEVISLFRNMEIVRDQAVPGTPIIKLDLSEGNLNESRLSALAKLPHLRSFEAWHVGQLNDNQVECLARLRQLQELWLFDAHVGASEWHAWTALPRLRSLRLVRSGIGDEDLKALAAFPRLQHIDLRDCENLTDAGVKEVVCLKRLRSLCLDGTAVTDDGLAGLAALQRLESLELFGCHGVTGAGLKKLAGCHCLRKLDLRCTEVTDGDVEDLGRLKQVRHLDLGGCRKMTADGIRKLRLALPDCEIVGP